MKHFPRSSGVLLHLTSLPGQHGSGDLGESAYHFVDWLVAAGQSRWQILPLVNIGPGSSPYMSNSAFAGNVLLINLEELQQHGWLMEIDFRDSAMLDSRHIEFGKVIPYRMHRLAKAAKHFEENSSPVDRADFSAFCEKHASWLEDYALFMALSEGVHGRDWCYWDAELATRNPNALEVASANYAERISFWKFCQWRFFHQWAKLKAYANQRGIRVIGDMPIYVAHNSVEAWVRPDLFELDKQGRPTKIAGVPPDVFSETGQRWGNPLYRWKEHEKEGFAWWIERIRNTFELVDILRIDHFIGFINYWEIPAHEPTAVNGQWVPAPGDALFSAITEALSNLPIIAEDLGNITPAVKKLRKKFNFPGMAILQFAWGENGEKRFLPHNYNYDTVVYTGTHDNDTIVSWWNSATEDERHHLREYLATDGRTIQWDLIRTGMASVADTVIFPLQDILGLSTEHRMNYPGKSEGYWTWRFLWSDVPADTADRLNHMSWLYDRKENTD
jgi:4-alpha-glucanotransferase